MYGKYVAGGTFRQVDLTGKVYIVTGSNTGIGYETAKQLVLMNATVVLACRSVDKANEAKDAISRETRCSPTKTIVLRLDLCDFDSVREFVKAFDALSLPLHCLINNAGVMMDNRTLTKVGTILTFSAYKVVSHLLHRWVPRR
jgi:NAD(P)-dependent dehydrogenase (short-subunit alcohol dehydrogenase family)